MSIRHKQKRKLKGRSQYHPDDLNSKAAGKGDRPRDGFDWNKFARNFEQVQGRGKTFGRLVSNKHGVKRYVYS